MSELCSCDYIFSPSLLLVSQKNNSSTEECNIKAREMLWDVLFNFVSWDFVHVTQRFLLNVLLCLSMVNMNCTYFPHSQLANIIYSWFQVI